jgi:hypothetical protein
VTNRTMQVAWPILRHDIRVMFLPSKLSRTFDICAFGKRHVATGAIHGKIHGVAEGSRTLATQCLTRLESVREL